MAEPELRAFIEAALAKGASDRFLADLLKSSGWAEKEILAAFREHYEGATGVSLPGRRDSEETSRDAFFYLIVFSTLATWSVALGSMLFSLIDYLWPDPVSMRGGYYPYARLNLSFQIACLLVAFPVFMFVSRRVNANVADEPRNRYSPVRKWLTYIALVIAAGVLIGDAVVVLAHFLQGEVSLRFIAKSLVVGAIALGIFRYYLGEVAAKADTDARRHRIFGAAATAAVAIGLVFGFTVTGPPSSQRALLADEQRERDLRAIAEAIHYASAPPPTLEELQSSPPKRDPVTGAAYEYRRMTESAYELCATFATDNSARREYFWVHSAGRKCFELDAKRRPARGY